MPTYFCNNDKCGFAIQYSVTKPERCPKCGKLLKIPVVVAKMITPISPPPVPPIEEEDDDTPLVAPKRVARAKVTPKVEPEEVLQEEVDSKEDDTYDRRTARRLARELLAKIDPDTIHISNEDDDAPVRFSDLIREAQTK